MIKPFQILLLALLLTPALTTAENYPSGARATGLSNAFVSISDPWSTFHNQATLADLNTINAGLFYESKFGIDELSLSAGSFVLPTKAGVFGFSLYQFGEGTFKEHKIGLAYALSLSEKLNAAVQLDYFSQQLPENSTSYGFATFEFGLAYKTTEQLTLGFHVFNPIKNGFEWPGQENFKTSSYRLGGHYDFLDLALISAEVQKTSNYQALWKTGLEFSPVKNLDLRFGISGRPVQYTLGLGYRIKKVSTDIAFSYHSYLGLTPSISLQFDF